MSLSSSSQASTRWRIAGLPGVLVVFTVLLALVVWPASPRVFATQNYTNNDGITFPNEGSQGPATPYPSKITVNGLVGSVVEVKVHVDDLSHSFPSTIDMLLVGPNGNYVLLMADAGANLPITNVDLTFQDGAAELPRTTVITSGTYRPTNHPGADVFPPAVAPNPSPPALGFPPNLSLESAFRLANPNGDWYLYLVKDEPAGAGTIGRWSIEIATVDLAIEVGDAPTTVIAGDTLTYTVTARNLGTEPVTNASVSIPLPPGTSFVGVTPSLSNWSCSLETETDTIKCLNATMPNGAVDSFAVELRVDQALARDTVLTRSATITSDIEEGPSVTANNSDSATTTVDTSADLEVVSVESTPDPINAGAELTTVFTVQNKGLSDALTATVTLPVPAATTFVSLAAAEDWTCTVPAVGGTGSSTCTAPVFVAGEDAVFTSVVKLNTTLLDGNTITSTASIASTTADGDNTNNANNDTVTIKTTTDLAVTVSDSPDPVSTAGNLTYTIVVTNNGPSNAANAQLNATVEPGTLFQSLTIPDGWACPTVPALNTTGPLVCTNPSFGVTSTTFTLIVRVVPGVPAGSILNFTASVSTTTTESDNTNDIALAETTVTTEADIALMINGPTDAKPGTVVTYTLTVNNAGPEFAEGIVLTTTVPANTTFVSLTTPTSTPPWNCTTPAAGGTGQIVCNKFSLDVGMSALSLAVQIGASTPLGTVITATGEVSVNEPQDPILDNNTASFTTTVDEVADLALTIGGMTTPVRAGTVMTYSLRLVNNGPENATTVRLTSAVPANTTFVALPEPSGWTCSTPAAGATGNITCTASSLAASASVTFTLSLTAGKVANDTTLTLTASATAAQTDSNTANNSASIERTLLGLTRVYMPLIRK